VLSTSSLGRTNNSSRGGGADGPLGPPRETPSERDPVTESFDPPPSSGGTGSEGWQAAVPIEIDRGFYLKVGKGVLDRVAAGLAMVFLSPLFLLLAVAIKLDTPGPVLYRSTRVGKGGKTFTFYKLRSMIHGAEQHRHRIAHLNEVTGPVFKIARDPRITRVGRILRRTSLDELPQILNVLKGDMTLVGPRPPLPDEVKQYELWQLRRLSVRPGLTCLWQISGRSRLTFDEWMRLDMEYITRRSFALDLNILIRTIPAVLSGEGAY
jgi:lipopolysaccharide/colanic/teichoic acid biosynthesis glycosyltransferase